MLNEVVRSKWCQHLTYAMVIFTVFLRCQNVVGLGVQKSEITGVQKLYQVNQSMKVHSHGDSFDRRRVLKKALSSFVCMSTLVTTTSRKALADTGSDGDNALPIIGNNKKSAPKKPFAPAPALIPPARVKYTIEEAIQLVKQLQQLDDASDSLSAGNAKNEIIMRLKMTIGVTSFMSPLLAENASKSKASPIDESIMKPSKSKVYQETYNEKLKDISPVDVPYAFLAKTGDYRQFDQLQRRQRKLEKLNPIREAFNYYTRQLQFDTEYYILNASAEVKKQMIRNDALPDIKSVIVADLDLRDLVRNQVLDTFDDVKFELEYQVKNYEKGNSFDDKEIMAVLIHAKSECDRWFDFISEEDVRTAMAVVANE